MQYIFLNVNFLQTVRAPTTKFLKHKTRPTSPDLIGSLNDIKVLLYSMTVG